MENSKMLERVLDTLEHMQDAIQELAVANSRREALLASLQEKLSGYTRPCPELDAHLKLHNQWRLRMAGALVGAALSLATGVICGLILAGRV